jgi:hypothetical protein
VLLNPAILALILVSAAVSLMLLLATGFAVQVLRHWEISSGSERQLTLERQTYLISTLLIWAFAAELVSLLLFVYNAEALSGQFVGAMCATGVLNVNAWGWPTLFLKIAVFFSGAAWLALNHLDNQGRDYPLVRIKYGLLLPILPLVLAESYAQLQHFLHMDPAVITSCCGALFSADAQGVAAEVAGLEPATALWLLYASGAGVSASGIIFLWQRRGGPLFALASLGALVLALVAIVSFIALYIYEHPNHHCPFCILKEGHGYVGYLLYIPLFGATAMALAAGVTAPWRRVPSITIAVDRLSRQQTWLALTMFGLFYLIASWQVRFSNLTMMGVWW